MESFFVRCFLTMSDGMKVFRRGWHGGMSGRSLDSVLQKRKGGIRLGGGSKGNSPTVDRALLLCCGKPGDINGHGNFPPSSESFSMTACPSLRNPLSVLLPRFLSNLGRRPKFQL